MSPVFISAVATDDERLLLIERDSSKVLNSSQHILACHGVLITKGV